MPRETNYGVVVRYGVFEGLVPRLLDLVARYGYVAVFAFMFLETSMLFPFLPSEVVLPSSAALLVTNSTTFWLFVASATAGATLGSLVNYRIFDVYGERALDRYGRYAHISEREVERGQKWFNRWGQSVVLWGRLFPVLRSVVSVPAGLAEMNVVRFTVYSAAGSFGFSAGVAFVVSTGLDLHFLP